MSIFCSVAFSSTTNTNVHPRTLSLSLHVCSSFTSLTFSTHSLAYALTHTLTHSHTHSYTHIHTTRPPHTHTHTLNTPTHYSTPSPHSRPPRDIAQKCYCGSANCRGYLGQTKQSAGRVGGVQREMGSPSIREGKRRGRQRAQSVEDSMVIGCMSIQIPSLLPMAVWYVCRYLLMPTISSMLGKKIQLI